MQKGGAICVAIIIAIVLVGYAHADGQVPDRLDLFRKEVTKSG